MRVSPATVHSYPWEMSSFYDCWWRHLAPKFDIVQSGGNFVAHRKTVLKGLRLKELRYAGWNNAWTQDLDLPRLTAFHDFARTHQAGWDYYKLRWRENGHSDQAFQVFSHLGYDTLQMAESPAYLIDLTDGFDAYLDSLGRTTRKGIRRQLRAVESMKPELRRFSGTEGIQRFFSLFFDHHRAYWDKKAGGSYFNDVREREFAMAWAEALEVSGHLLLEGFYLNGTLCNLTMNILAEDVLYSVLTINTDAYPEYAPGLLSLYYRARNADEFNIRLINMGDGDHGYKSRISNRQEPYYSIMIANPHSVAGTAYLQWIRSRSRLVASKQVLERIQLEWKTGQLYQHNVIQHPAVHHFCNVAIADTLPSLESMVSVLPLIS